MSNFHKGDHKIEQGYLGKDTLPLMGVERKYTTQQLIEIAKCSADIEYFARTYFTIVSMDEGRMLIPLYPYQEKLLHKFQDNRFNIVTQARQSGKTTTATIFILHYILFNADKRVAILANKGKTARMVLGRIKLAYELLPNFLKAAVTKWNESTLELENGTRIDASATSADSISGDSVSLLYIDEVAKIENWDEFYSATYPTIASGKTTQVIMVSTAKGLNHYYQLWNKAMKGKSDFVPTEVTWQEVPHYDEAWKEETLKNTSEDQFAQEFENVFMGSQDTLIKMSTLRELLAEDSLYNKDGVKIYNMPEAGHNYCITVDTGHGKGLNYSAFSVFDITEYPFKQVATFRADDISPFMYPNIILKIAIQFNKAWVVVENNDMGAVVAAIMNYDLEYENMINPKDVLGDSAKTVKYEVGTRTTTRTKSIGCSTLKDLVESQKLILQDEQTITELMTFIAKGKSYEADKDCYDDMVMTLVIFSWFTSQELFNEIFFGGRTVSKELYERRIQEALEDLPPAIFIDDGVTTDMYDLEPGEKLW